MKMKSKILTTGALLFLFSPLVQAGNGTIAVEGKIVDGTCALQGAAEENGTPSTNLTFTMHRDMTTTAIIESEAWGDNYKDFHIHFICASTMISRNIQVKISATEYQNEILLNTDKSGPSNIGFRIRDQDRQFINYDHLDPGTTYSIPAEKFSLAYTVSYTRLNNEPIATGPIVSTIYYDVTYL
ncbi:type 1 fimbrial protein [Klebsiella huaxiensis]|uniref:fimbrial protein n=1 Tax=Klebsiella huaxiensis TaxID=2153354 RepID=UPI002F33CA83